MRRLQASPFRVAIALAVTLTVAGCGSSMQTAHSNTATATTQTATTNGAVPVAQLVALARGSLPGLGDSTVSYASVVTTTKGAAENWLEPGSVRAAGSSPRAYLIVLRGRFVCQSCTRPLGASAPQGSSAQLIWIPGVGVSDFGLTTRVPTGLNRLGRVLRLSLRRHLLVHVMPPPPIRLVPATPLRAHPVTPLRETPVAQAPVAASSVPSRVVPSRAVPVTPPGMMNGTPVH
ncbi:MAG: hypothetical protein ACRDPA_03545 [Solirubrobacteraceae bacterium]